MAPPPRQDLGVAVLASLAAAGAVAVLPDGSLLRIAVAAPAILVVPGYLLLEATSSPPGDHRLRNLLGGLGVSPVLVGLLALSTALVRGGFRPLPIVAVTTLACVVLAVIAGARRRPVAIGHGHGPSRPMAGSTSVQGPAQSAAVFGPNDGK